MGVSLDILVQKQRDAKAARRVLKRLTDRFGARWVAITDKLRSDVRSIRNLAPNADHRAHKGLNNRIEGTHRPTPKPEKLVGRFKSPGQARRFLTAHDQLDTIFRPHRYRLTATSYRDARSDAFDLCNDHALEMTA